MLLSAEHHIDLDDQYESTKVENIDVLWLPILHWIGCIFDGVDMDISPGENLPQPGHLNRYRQVSWTSGTCTYRIHSVGILSA